MNDSLPPCEDRRPTWHGIAARLLRIGCRRVKQRLASPILLTRDQCARQPKMNLAYSASRRLTLTRGRLQGELTPTISTADSVATLDDLGQSAGHAGIPLIPFQDRRIESLIMAAIRRESSSDCFSSASITRRRRSSG